MVLMQSFGKYLALVFLAFLPGLIAAQAEETAEYVLGSGDLISIYVFDEDDLSIDAKLGGSGTLNYPFIGKLKVAGMTVSELQKVITSGLKGDYLVDPKVSINIIEYRKFFINGEVKRPGGFAFQPGLTVGKAVTLAEGFTERANQKRIFVISDEDKTSPPRQVSLGSLVKPGDIITIEQSFF